MLADRSVDAGAQGTVTPCSTTGPIVGSSSVACETPEGVIVSITLGTVFGRSEQIGLVPPDAQTPNVKLPGVVVNARARSGLNPS
jgi:hypothetical protein